MTINVKIMRNTNLKQLNNLLYKLREIMKHITAFFLAVLLLFSVCSCAPSQETDTVAFDKKSARVIAHRGLSGLEFENTKEAFVAAGNRSYYGIEADVRRTADGKFIVCHDDNLQRLAGNDMIVEATAFDELLAVPLSDGKGCERRLCDLDTYISLCKSYEKQAILELKSDFTEQEIAQIVDVVRSHGYLERVTFISFYYSNLEYVRRISPEQSVQYLFSQVSDELTERLIRDRIDVAILHGALTEEALAVFHGAGLTVNCWTVDDKATAEALAAMGVDYITTNILE